MNTVNRTVIGVRWLARILTVLILLFWGYFILAHLFASEAQSLRALSLKDGLQFWMIVLWLAGLALAWRWELIGAAVALAAILIATLINPHVLPIYIPPAVTATLFLFCWWMTRASRAA